MQNLLEEQRQDAILWRDACVLYFQEFSGKPIPQELTQPEHPLSYYKNLEYEE